MLHIEITFRVIDCEESLAYLIGLEDVLFEVSGDPRPALVNAAPGGDRVLTRLIDVGLEVVAHLADNQHLLVFHDTLAVMILEESLDVILYLALRSLVHLVTHELET